MHKALAILSLLTAVSMAAQEHVFRETLEVEIVNVDVVVVDGKGAPVTDLTQSDFEVLVDGKPVAITNFSAYVSGVGHIVESAPSTQSISARPQQAPPATWIVFVDILHVVPTRRAGVLRRVEEFLLGDALRPGDRILIALFDGDAFRIEQPLTSDVRLAAAALERVQRRVASREFAAVPGMITSVAALLDLRERRIRSSLYALHNLTALASGIDGRVALLIVGGGYRMAMLNAMHQSRIRRLYGTLLERLVEGRITAYTIYAGPESLDGLNAGSRGGRPLPAPLTIASAGEIGAFADETGGIAFNAAGAAQLARVRTDLEHYYSLGFRRTSQAAGKPSDLDVRVRRPDLRVRHRHALRVRTDSEAAWDDTMGALLEIEAPANPWGLRVVAAGARRLRWSQRTTIDVHVPLTYVMLSPASGGKRAGKLTFHFALRDGDGAYQRIESRELPLTVDKRDVGGQTIRYTVQLDLPRGANDLAVTVADAGGRSTARTTIDVP